MTPIDMESVVVALLKANAGVTALFYGRLTGEIATTGYRIYPDQLEQGTALPAAVFFEVDGISRETTDGPGLETSRIEIDVYASSRMAAWSGLAAIDACLCPRQGAGQVGIDRFVNLTVGGLIRVQGIVPGVRNSFYEHDTKLYRRGRDYHVTASAA